MNISILIILSFVGGFIIGGVFTLLVTYLRSKTAETLVREVVLANEKHVHHAQELMMSTLKGNFAELSQRALLYYQDQFLKLAELRLGQETERNAQELAGKKILIDKQLEHIAQKLQQVSDMVSEYERDREMKFGALSKELQILGQDVTKLSATTLSLEKALANNRSRGQWGERIAEDILHMMGLLPNVHYIKQTQMGSPDARGRPDFTFVLPQDQKLNMDVKFPFDNYFRTLQAEAEADRNLYLTNFLKDVRAKIKELSDRGYVDTAQDTVDCVLMFIPNEQIYRFIHEHDSKIIDEALRKKVVMCSPLTLFVVLAVIRQAVLNFTVQKSSREILDLLGDFEKQWRLFKDQFDTVGDRLQKLEEAYETLRGVRTRQLEKPLVKIAELRKHYQWTSNEPTDASFHTDIAATND